MAPLRARPKSEPLNHLEKIRDFWTSDVSTELCRPLLTASECLERLSRKLVARLGEGAVKDELEETRRALGAIQRVIRLSRDLEQFSKLDARKLELHRRPVDLRTLIREVARDLSLSAQGRPLELIERGPLGSVVVDPVRLEQVMINLIANALQFGDPGTPIRIEIEFHPHGVGVSVINQGKGIASEELPHVFESRFNPAQIRETGTRGLGLGLYVTRGLIEAHGGKIWAESEPGKETAFRFTLPYSPGSG